MLIHCQQGDHDWKWKVVRGQVPHHCPIHRRAAKNAYIKDYYEQARAWAREVIKATKERPCEDCDVEYPTPVMHFDHVRGKKKFGIAGATITASLSDRFKQELLDEIAKCDVVCANCHAIRGIERDHLPGY